MYRKISCIEEEHCGYVEYVLELPEDLFCPWCYRVLLIDYRVNERIRKYEITEDPED